MNFITDLYFIKSDFKKNIKTEYRNYTFLNTFTKNFYSYAFRKTKTTSRDYYF